MNIYRTVLGCEADSTRSESRKANNFAMNFLVLLPKRLLVHEGIGPNTRYIVTKI
jgi:hypothetical protein